MVRDARVFGPKNYVHALYNSPKMDAIPTDPHIDTMINICILMDVIVPKLEYAGEVREWARDVRMTTGNSADDSS